jgi:hypothetical protein
MRDGSTVEPLVLLGKPDCHLCHEMREIVVRVLGAAAATRLREQDVREDPELRARYASEIPVLLLAGREIARHRVDERTLRERLLAAGYL